MALEQSSIVEVSSLLATMAAALLVGRQTYAHFIRNRAFAYIERFNHKDQMELRIEVEQWLARNPGRDALSRLAVSRDPEEIAVSIRIRTFINLFQELAVAFEKGMVDRKIFYHNFDFLITSHWDRLEEFIFSYRAHTGDYTLYKRFERMAAKVKRHRIGRIRRRLFVFGYGSLRVPRSVHATLRRPTEDYRLMDAELDGYRRAWNITVPLFSEARQRPVEGIFLNVARDAGARTRGVLLEVSEEELSALRRREVNYDCLEVTPYVRGVALDPGDAVVTFIGQERHLLAPHRDAYVMERYLAILQEAGDPSLLEIGGLPCLEGEYRFNPEGD